MLGDSIFTKAIVLIGDHRADFRGIGADRITKPTADFKCDAFAMPRAREWYISAILEHLLTHDRADFALQSSVALCVAYDFAFAISVGFEFEGIFCPAGAIANLIGAYDEPLSTRAHDFSKHIAHIAIQCLRVLRL